MADWIMRVALGFIFIVAGYEKVFILGPDKFASLLNISSFWGWAASIGELAGGVGILAGGLLKNKIGDLTTRFSGALNAFVMVVAFFMVKINGFTPDVLKGLEGSFDVIAIFAMSMYYTFMGNDCCCSEHENTSPKK